MVVTDTINSGTIVTVSTKNTSIETSVSLNLSHKQMEIGFGSNCSPNKILLDVFNKGK